MLGADRDMHRPQRDKLTEADGIHGVIVPKPHGEYTRVICKLDLEVALRRFVLLARFGYVVEIDDAALEREIARTRLETA